MRVVAIAAALLLLACQAKPAAAPDQQAADAAVTTSVTALIVSWAKAGSDGDWDALVNLYADNDDFVWVERGQIRYANHAAVVSGLEGAKAAGSRVETHVSDIVVTPLASDTASFRAHVVFKLDYENGAPPVDVDAIVTGVAVDYDTGWKLLQGHLEQQQPAAPAPVVDAQSPAQSPAQTP